MPKKQPPRRPAKGYHDYTWQDGPPPAWLREKEAATQSVLQKGSDARVPRDRRPS